MEFQENYPIDKLIPYARNSRTHNDEQIAQIAASIKEFGFTNPNRVEYKGINVSMLQALSEKLGTAVIDLDTLVESGFVSKKAPVKILGNGELSAKLDVKANAFSKSAIAKIEAAGGTATVIE